MSAAMARAASKRAASNVATTAQLKAAIFLLRRWLAIDSYEDDAIAPANLVQSSRDFIKKNHAATRSLSPVKEPGGARP